MEMAEEFDVLSSGVVDERNREVVEGNFGRVARWWVVALLRVNKEGDDVMAADGSAAECIGYRSCGVVACVW